MAINDTVVTTGQFDALAVLGAHVRLVEHKHLVDRPRSVGVFDDTILAGTLKPLSDRRVRVRRRHSVASAVRQRPSRRLADPAPERDAR